MPQFSFSSPRSDNCLQLIPSLNVYFVSSDDTEVTSSRNRLSVDSIELAWLGWYRVDPLALESSPQL